MKIIVAIIFTVTVLSSFGQTNTSLPPVDKSPLDISYYPVDYPILRIQNKAPLPPVVRVIYSRPQLNGRKVFGGLQDYGEIWRMGANEATEIEFFRDVKINNKKIKKGRYTLYAIPYPDRWIFIINSDTDTWGSFKYTPGKDIIRVNLPVQKNTVTENMTITFAKNVNGAEMVICWEDVKTIVPIEF